MHLFRSVASTFHIETFVRLRRLPIGCAVRSAAAFCLGIVLGLHPASCANASSISFLFSLFFNFPQVPSPDPELFLL